MWVFLLKYLQYLKRTKLKSMINALYILRCIKRPQEILNSEKLRVHLNASVSIEVHSEAKIPLNHIASSYAMSWWEPCFIK